MDYIIGRLNGKFLPNDPTRYHRSRRNWPSQADFDLKMGRNHDKTIADTTEGETYPAVKPVHNLPFSLPANEKPLNNSQIGFPSNYHRPINNMPRKRSDLKLMLYKSLLYKYFPADADGLFSIMVYLINQGGNDDFLDQQIAILQQVHQSY